MKEEMVFERDAAWFEARKAGATVKEVLQQPALWDCLADTLDAREKEITSFMSRVLAVPGLRIVFTGAGSSAFIGESLQKMLMRDSGLHSEAVHTTEIVAAPDITLYDVPTLLVSFARSGDSPESVATLKYARKKVKELYNLVVVCNERSALADYASEEDGTLVLNMPQEACDIGFAMTSSVSCMVLGTWCAFGYKTLRVHTAYLRALAESVRSEMPALDKTARAVAANPYRRVVYLGTGALYGLAREGAVKSLELTNGYVNATFDTPTGFRHGPKTVLDDETLSVHFLSPDAFTQRYDLDVAEELIHEKKKNIVAVVVSKADAAKVEGADYLATYDEPAGGSRELCAYIKSLLFAQLLSVEKSLERGVTTDSPCPKGEVNRVVRGVVIYDL